MKTTKRTITVFWKYTVTLFLVLLMGYITLGLLLSAPQEPEPISLNDCAFEREYSLFYGQYASIYVRKTVSSEESHKYVQDWERLNYRIDRRDLTEFLGINKPLSTISRIRCLVKIDCSSSKYIRSREEYYDQNENMVRYITYKRRHKTWIDIPEYSTIKEQADRLASQAKATE